MPGLECNRVHRAFRSAVHSLGDIHFTAMAEDRVCMNHCRHVPLRAAGLSLSLLLAACAADGQAERNKAITDAYANPPPVIVADLDLRPRSFESHYNKALYLLAKEKRSDFDLHLSRVGFETAARLSRDYWPAWAYAGIVHDMLGNHEQAMNAFVQAAFIEDSATLWNAAALAALRGGYEQLAYSLHRRAQTARLQGEDSISGYMESAYRPGDAARPITRTAPSGSHGGDAAKYICRAPEKDDDDDDDDDDYDDDDKKKKGTNLGNLNLDFDFIGADRKAVTDAARADLDCEQQNVVVDAYIIRRNGESASTVGIDLLSALQIQFGAQLVDFTYSNPSGSGNASSSVSGSASVEIPDVTYALSLASDRQNFVTIDATPSIVARLGEKSQIFEGTEVYIIANGDSSSGEFQKEIGVKMSIEPVIVTESAVTLTAGVEFSLLNATSSPSDNFQMLNTDKLIFDISGTFPFGAAVLIGKLSSAVVKENGSGQTGLRSVPGLRNLFGEKNASSTSREVLVLATVRQPASLGKAALDSRLADLHERFNVDPPEDEVVRYGYIHQAPSLAALAGELGLERAPVSIAAAAPASAAQRRPE